MISYTRLSRRLQAASVLFCCALGSIIFPASAPGGVYTWNGTVGTWDTASRWNPQQVPGPYDTVNIPSGTVILDYYINFYGTMNWSGGTLAGDPLTIENGGTLNISASVTLDCPLANLGTVNWVGGNIYFDTCGDSTAGPLVNQGLFNIECDAANLSCIPGVNAYFVNTNGGVVVKTITTGTTYFNVPFYNSAWVDADSGTISLDGGGLLQGAFQTEANTAINFDGGYFPLAYTAPAASGAGQVQFTGNSTVSFLGGMSGVLNMAGGSISNPLTIVSNSTVNGILNITGSVSVEGALTNQGTVNWLGGNVYLPTCTFTNAGPLVNQGQWNIQSGQDALYCDTNLSFPNAYFTNSATGTVLKTNATGTTLFTLPFYNSGTVQADSGIISLELGGALGGSFVAEAGAAIDFDGGNFPLVSAAPAASGAGQVQFTGSGGIAFSQPMTGVLNCAGGIIGEPLTISAGGVLNINGIGVTLNSALTNSGTVNWLGGNIYMAACNAGPLVNLPGAQWNIQSGLTNSCTCPLGTNAEFINEGKVLKTIGTDYTFFSIAFTNTGTGTVEADTGAIVLDQGGLLGGSFVAEPGAAIDFNGGSFPLTAAAPAASGAGQVQFTGAAGITFSAPMTGVLNMAGGIISGPLTIAANGTINILGNVTVDSAITNLGAVNWLGGNIFMDTVDYPLAGPVANMGQWNIQCNETISDNNPEVANAYFTNAGTLLKTSSTGTTYISIPLNNSGTVQADSGIISLEWGGDLNGSFVTEAGAGINFDGGSFPLTGAAPAASGAGLVQFSSLAASITCSAPMTGVMNCAGATFAGPLTIAANGTNNITGNVALEGAFTNLGTVNWLGGNVFLDTCHFPLAGPVVNLGQWNIGCDMTNSSCLPGSANAYFINMGTVLKTNTTGITLISIPFYNSGTLQANSGTVQLTDGGALGGQFVTALGAAIDFLGGSFSLSGAAPVSSGAGLVQFGGSAETTFSGPMTSVLNFTGGTIASSLTIASGGVLNISGSVALQGALTNSGTVNWLAGNVYLDTCTSNLAGPVVNLGKWNIQCDSTNLSCVTGPNAYFINQGTVLKTNATGTTLISIPFNNSGTLQADSGTLVLTSGGALEGQFVVATNTAIDFESGNFTLAGAAPPASGPGIVQFTSTAANITCAGPMSGVLNCAGATIAGPLAIVSGSALNITGSVALQGALTNSGTVNWLAGNVYLDTCTSNLAGPVVNLGQWNILCDSTNLSCVTGPNAYFVNQGTVLKTNTTGTTIVLIPFNNYGTLQVDSGTLVLMNGGALSGGFVTKINTVIDFESGDFALAGAAPAASGPGLVQFTSTAANITCSGAMSGILNCVGATFAGPLTLAVGSTLNITGSVAVDSALTNRGTVNWLAGNVYLDTCTYPSAGPLVNLGQWNIECDTTNSSCQTGPNAYFINGGTLLKTITTGTTIVSIPFDNSGTLQLDSGTMELTNGGTLGGEYVTAAWTRIDLNGGSFSMAGNTLMSSGAGLVQFGGNAGVTFSGPVNGVLNFSGGTIAGQPAIASGSSLNISGIGVTLQGSLTNYGTVNWLEGNVYLDTCTSNQAGPVVNMGQWNIQSGQTALSCEEGANAYFTNSGTVLKTNDTGTTSFSIPFNNSGTLQADSGTLELTGGGVLGGQFVAETNTAIDFESGNFALNGAAPAGGGPGLLQFTGINAAVTCSGPMSGVLNCSLATLAGPFTIAPNGVLNITGIGVQLYSSLTNLGTVNWLSGVVFLDTAYFPAGPVVNLPGGLWNIQCDQSVSDNMNAAAAYFTNAGTVLKTNTTGTTAFYVPFFNSGTVQPDTGTILFDNGYAETSSADLLFSLGGPAPGSDYGQIQFNYAPTFAGALSAATRNGYLPSLGAVFTVLDYPGFAGAFSSTNLYLGGGVALQPQFTAGYLTLTAVTGVAPGAPQMSISLSTGSATIQWTPGFSGWVLQSTTNLLTPNWTPVTVTGNSTVVPITGRQQYFRMHNGE